MKDRKKIQITPLTKGILVYARCENNHDEWLILIYNVNKNFRRNGELYITRHISYSIRDNIWCFNKFGEADAWGYTTNYNFYEPTQEERKLVVDALKKRHKKFIPILNKLIDI